MWKPYGIEDFNLKVELCAIMMILIIVVGCMK
jgi:hypothetical protein